MSRRWISVHIFYSSNGNPLLADCIAPLVAKLRTRGLLSRYFFIRYWLGGPHIRLRLSPAEGVSDADVKEVVEADLRAFLARRPALFELDRKTIAPLYKTMYEAEYGAEEFAARFGPDGDIPFYDNNSFHYIDYEPEYDRYGGEDGIDLSERHFEVSSDIVLKLVQETNVHLRGIAMGHSVQLMLQTCYAFLGDDARICNFLERYMDFWQTSYSQNSKKLYPGFERKYAQMSAKLHKRVEEVRAMNESDDPTRGTEGERSWIAHMKEVRDEVRQLVAEKRLSLMGGVDTEDAALAILLSSYLHMTNNRLGVSILDEIYLSYIIRRTLEVEDAPALAEVSGG
jgi:thiopeptide-type bacteriocin biosynthesis protein